MTRFNPENKEVLTFGEILDPAMKITDKFDAQQYLASYASWLQGEWDKRGETAKEPAVVIAKANLGYWAGYYSNEVRDRVERLFECEHPVFGSIEKNGVPTAKEAFELGVKMGEASRKKGI